MGTGVFLTAAWMSDQGIGGSQLWVTFEPDTWGGDPICGAESYNQRLDVADGRRFLGQYLNLPSCGPKAIWSSVQSVVGDHCARR